MHEFPVAVQAWVNIYRTGQGITIHGFQAIDKALIQGVALDRNHRETIILSGD
jgi:hypothetical protein